MVTVQKITFIFKAGQEDRRALKVPEKMVLFEILSRKISHFAVILLLQHYRWANHELATGGRPICTQNFSAQFGLPFKYWILKILQDGGSLAITIVCKHCNLWHEYAIQDSIVTMNSTES